MAIKICVGDNHPVVHYGLRAYFAHHSEIQLVANDFTFEDALKSLKDKDANMLITDLEITGLSGIGQIKQALKNNPLLRIVLFTNLAESIYAPNAIRMGVSAFVHKSEKIERLEKAIMKVAVGETLFNDEIRKKLSLALKQPKSERLYRKLSTREIEVLRYLTEGKKNNEISKILDLNEKTISTYKLRLLTKLNVTNLVDLINKARTLEIV